MSFTSFAKRGGLFVGSLFLGLALSAVLLNTIAGEKPGEKPPPPPKDKDCGTGTPGYWKNHPNAWPAEGIMVGGVLYTYDTAIVLLDLPDGDKSLTLFRATISAKLNALCAESSCVDDTILAADLWLAANPPGSLVDASTEAWQGDEGKQIIGGEVLYLILDDYNNGLLCAPSRDTLE